jgi:hypothetical protein
MSITGHARKDMDDRYNRVADSDKLKTISQLEAYRESVREESEKFGLNPLIFEQWKGSI